MSIHTTTTTTKDYITMSKTLGDFHVVSYGYSLHESTMSPAQVGRWVMALRENAQRGDDGCGNDVELVTRSVFPHACGGVGFRHVIRYANGTGHTLIIGRDCREVTHFLTS